MNGVLVIAHGSREKQTEETFNAVVNMAKEKVNQPIEIAYMEFSDQNIEAGLNKLVAQGVTNVKAVPYFLFSGIHIRQDIPEEIEKFTIKNSGITVTLADTLGADPRIADVLADRILG